MISVSSIVLRDGARVLLAAGNVFIDLSGASFHLWGQGSPFGSINARHRIEALMLGGDDASCTLLTQTGQRFIIGVTLNRTHDRCGCITVSVTDDDGNWVGQIIERLCEEDRLGPRGAQAEYAGAPCLLN